MDALGPWNPAVIDTGLDARAATFENPTGDRGAGGTAHGGRKGAPSRRIRAGERVVLADLDGSRRGPPPVDDLPARVRPSRCGPWSWRCSTTASTARASRCRASTSSGCPTVGRWPTTRRSPRPTRAAGSTAGCPCPSAGGMRIEFVNGSSRATTLYYQVDYTLQPELDPALGYLHVAFRRENPTAMARDIVIADGLRGPGPLPRGAWSACGCSTRAPGTAKAR